MEADEPKRADGKIKELVDDHKAELLSFLKSDLDIQIKNIEALLAIGNVPVEKRPQLLNKLLKLRAGADKRR
jgi:hypothetical protein